MVAAGCDPALPLLEAPLRLLDPPVAFSWWPCPSREALRLAADGLVHVAGTHLRGPGSDYNITPAADLLPGGGEVIGFCSWQEGLVLRPELADTISGISDVAGSGLRLVNREPGAEARSLLDRELDDAGMAAGPLHCRPDGAGPCYSPSVRRVGPGHRSYRQQCCHHARARDYQAAPGAAAQFGCYCW